MKAQIFTYIFLLILLIIKTSSAQEVSSTNSKSYEAKTIKKDNEIEIRLIPKNPLPKIEKTPTKIQNSIAEEDDSALENETTKDPEMVYEKKAEDNNLSPEETNNIKTKNANLIKENSLKLWREEQRKLREERIEARKEEARKKYQAQKERSVIKEIENLNKKLKEETNSKKTTPNFYSGSTAPSSNQNINSNAVLTNPNSNSNPNTVSNSINASSSSSTNSASPVANSSPNNIPTQNSR